GMSTCRMAAAALHKPTSASSKCSLTEPCVPSRAGARLRNKHPLCPLHTQGAGLGAYKLTHTFMAERETREITTPGGHKVVLRAYLTGREANELKSVIFSALTMNIEDAQNGKVNVSDVPGTFLVEQEKKALSFLLVSIDGDTTAPIDKLLDLPALEYEAV